MDCFRSKRILIALMVSLSLSYPLSQSHALPPPPDGLALIWGSGADIARPTALRLNPAGLAFQPSWGIHYVHADSGIPFQSAQLGDGDGLFVSFKPLPFWGIGASLQLLYPSPTDANNQALGFHSRLTLGSAFRFGKWLSLGVNFHAFLGADAQTQRLGSFDIGLILRPLNFLSLGVMARNLNAPAWEQTFIPRKWELSLALRPLSDHRWVISADVHIPEFTPAAGGPLDINEGIQFLYRTEFSPTPGLTLGLRFQHGIQTGTLQGGVMLGFSFGHVGFRGYGQANFAPGQDPVASYGGTMVSLWYSQMPYRSLTRPSGLMPMLDLGGSLPERVNDFPFGGVKPLFLRLIMALDKVAKDPSVAGLMLRIGAISCGMAKVQELRAAIQRIQKKGKKVVVYLTATSLKGYYLASAADQVYLYPNGSVRFGGLSIRHAFYADFLDQIGIKPQYVKFGKYKTAPNRYTHKQMTPAHKEAYKALLDDLFAQLLQDIAKSRGKKPEDIKKWLAHGWFSAEEARRFGLVDKLLYWEKVPPQIAKVNPTLQLDVSYFGRRHPRSRWRGYDQIAVLHVDGAIVSGTSLDDPLFGTRLSGSHSLIQYLIKAQYNPRIRAVVLRVDSPGGGVLASDMLWRYVNKLRRYKPVIVSMATVAASGGYYISAPATEIFAMPATVTGSIGIYAGKFDFSGLLRKLGIKQQFQRRGPLAGFFSPYLPFSKAQRERIRGYIKAGYESFLDKVAAGRKGKLTKKQLRGIAAGRIWSGQRAQKNGLVDRIGGVWDAIQRAKELAEVSKDHNIRIISWPNKGYWRLAPNLAIGIKAQAPQDPLARLLSLGAAGGTKAQSQGPFLAQLIQHIRVLIKRIQQTQAWALLPHSVYVP